MKCEVIDRSSFGIFCTGAGLETSTIAPSAAGRHIFTKLNKGKQLVSLGRTESMDWPEDSSKNNADLFLNVNPNIRVYTLNCRLSEDNAFSSSATKENPYRENLAYQPTFDIVTITHTASFDWSAFTSIGNRTAEISSFGTSTFASLRGLANMRVREIEGKTKEKGIHAGLDLIYSSFNRLFRNSQFWLVDQILDAVEIQTTQRTILIGYLTATLPAKKKLSNRAKFFQKVKEVLETRHEIRPRLLDGLES